jgi:hypothetical protein
MVSKKTLKNLAPYCLNPIEKKRMLFLSENSEQMKKEITNKRYGLLDLFTQPHLFPSCKPSLIGLF